MHCCFIDPGHASGETVMLAREEAHYLRNVVRARDNEQVRVADGAGGEWFGILRFGGRHASVELSAERVRDGSQGAAITLWQALPKGRKMDLIVEKAVELGVAEIYPFSCANSVVRLGDAESRVKTARWRRVAMSAVRQCGRQGPPVIHEITDVAGVAASVKGRNAVFTGVLAEGTPGIRAVIDGMQGCSVAEAGFIIGPEGDLTPGEIQVLRNAGAIPVNFGPIVLRCETAAIFSLSVLLYKFGACRD